ncbi:MAG TPA: TolC family protein [Bdellovibrio sp.]|uniref:TolC family protein n=1 Tax=Bdellovibrio sp. TaxID=28201 RepID=UPI002F18B18D
MTWTALKKTISLGIASFFIAMSAFAGTSKVQAPPTSVTINADTLKKMLLEQNIGLLIQMNKVYQAKQQINIKRADLLPSINLGGIISSGPSFALTTISSLLPFLMPSNWFDLKQSQYLLNAQATSYYIAQLNTYSSAYALYMTVVGDLELRDVLYSQYLNYKQIEELIQLAVDAGMMQQSDLLQAQAQSQLAFIQVSQVDELLKQEKASIREMLALPLSTEIAFEKNHVAPSANETLPLQTLVDRSLKNSPEISQMTSMISAANTAKWSAAFSWLTGASLGRSRSGGESAFGGLTASGTVGLGFGYFPTLKLSDYNIDELKLEKTQITYDNAQLIESTVGSLTEAQKQVEMATLAQNNLQQVYNGELDKFRAGMTDLLHVLSAANSLTTALTNKVKAQADLDTLRVSLNRVMLDEKFSQVGACEIKRKSSGGIGGRLGRIFHPTKDQVTLDEICGPQTLN